VGAPPAVTLPAMDAPGTRLASMAVTFWLAVTVTGVAL
jgi:hypothetical protein